jgi:hypothetical protein
LGKGLFRAARWYLLLQKRLLKKPSFLILLAAVPLVVAALVFVAQQDSGVLCVALCQEEGGDALASSVVERLTGESGVIRFVVYDSADEAAASVAQGETDAAWIFPAGMAQRLGRFLDGAGSSAPVVRIVEREDTVFLQLAREKLFSVLYSPLSFQVYSDYIQEELTQEEVSQEELEEYYHTVVTQGSLIEFSFMHQEESAATAAEQDYLTAPVRGLLALMILLCGLASAMYFTWDELQGSFVWLPARWHRPFAYAYHLIAVTDMAAVVYAALLLAGVFTTWQRELPLMLLYCVAVSGFCELVRGVLPRIEWLGIAAPLLILVMLVLCPIFINVRRLRPVQFLLAPFYYLHGVHNRDYVLLLLAYTAAVYLLSFLVHRGKVLLAGRVREAL